MIWDSLGKLIRNEMYQTACRRVAPLENDWDVIPKWWCFRHCEGEKADLRLGYELLRPFYSHNARWE